MPRASALKCYFGCVNNGPLHQFPKPHYPHTERFNQWKSILKLETIKRGDTYIFNNIRLCSRHFNEYFQSRSRRLTQNAVPTLNLCADNAILHLFPDPRKELDRFNKWIYAIGGNLFVLDPLLVFKSGRVCHSHFKEKYCTASKGLSRNAIPSLDLSGIRITPRPPLQQVTNKSSRFSLPAVLASLDHPTPYNVTEEAVGSTSKITADPNITVNATFQPSKPMIISEGYNSDHHSFVSPVSHLVSEPSVSTPSRACVESVAADTCKTDDKTTQADTRPIPKENNAGYWKQKLTHILHSTEFCGICLSTDELVNTVSDHFEIVVGGTSHSRTLADILDVVFQETEDLLSNSQICSSCTQKLFQSYMFIQQARARSKMLKYHLNDLYYKTCYIRNNVVQDLPQEHSDITNVLISMENYDNLDQFQNNLYTKPAKKKVKRDRLRLKQSYKCLTCNLILPSHKAWRVHEITNHKINKMSKTQLNSVTPHQRILKRMCRICHKVIKNGELFKHLKKYHVDSLCPVCCVAFHSLEDLEAHKQEWHYSDVSKCLTCLRSYSEAELQQHQCLFRCNVCTEAPCVHHKYLTCYRLQILNGALRAKCLDCQFVCRTKRVYLEHVNMCHLKFSAESSVKCTE